MDSHYFSLPDVIYNIITFADLRGTYNLLQINRHFHRIVTSDRRFILLRVICCYSKRSVNIFWDEYLELIDLIKTCKYFYYKLIPHKRIWQFNTANEFADYCSHFYQVLNNHDIITNAPKFYPAYNKYYYACKHLNETYDTIKYYKLNFNQIIKYVKNNDNPYRTPEILPGIVIDYSVPAFQGFIAKLPIYEMHHEYPVHGLVYLKEFENTEFAVNTYFLQGLNSATQVYLRFMYRDVICRVHKVSNQAQDILHVCVCRADNINLTQNIYKLKRSINCATCAAEVNVISNKQMIDRHFFNDCDKTLYEFKPNTRDPYYNLNLIGFLMTSLKLDNIIAELLYRFLHMYFKINL